mgnify:CR=1 FL=1
MNSEKFEDFQPTGFVYLASIPESDWYKIGESASPERRIRRLDAPCELLHVIETFHRESVEKSLLERLSGFPSQGREWFRVPKEIAEEIPEMMEDARIEEPNLEDQLLLNFEQVDPYTVQEVAQSLTQGWGYQNDLARNRKYVQRRILNGDLKAYDLDGEPVVFPRDLRDWLGDENYERLFLSGKDEP